MLRSWGSQSYSANTQLYQQVVIYFCTFDVFPQNNLINKRLKHFKGNLIYLEKAIGGEYLKASSEICCNLKVIVNQSNYFLEGGPQQPREALKKFLIKSVFTLIFKFTKGIQIHLNEKDEIVKMGSLLTAFGDLVENSQHLFESYQQNKAQIDKAQTAAPQKKIYMTLHQFNLICSKVI